MGNNLKIYLAGAMSGLTFDEMNGWRKDIKNLLITRSKYVGSVVNVTNPVDYYNFEEKRHKNELEVMNFDLNKVKHSDLVVVNMQNLNTSLGTVIELYEAYKSGIPVLAIGDEDTYKKLHPWVQCCITRYDNTYRDIVDYIVDFYML